MKSFVLPPLHSSVKGALWCSRVPMPPPSDLVSTVSGPLLPSVEKSRRRQELRRMETKVAALELVVEMERLERMESKLRSVICGREHEKRHQFFWHYQKEKSKVERETAAIEAKSLALQRSKYMRFVHDYQERGHLLHLETITRARMIGEEEDARRHVASLRELVLLEERRRQVDREAATAECIARDLRGIRDWESRIAARSFYPTEAFSPAAYPFPPRNVGTGGYRGRADLLMDYDICEEEWNVRLALISEERVEHHLLEWQHGVLRLQLVEETQARVAIEELCVYGSCQARLSAILRIQRWWRMLQRTGWNERKRRELKKYVAQRRNKMNSRDYRAILGRMRRQLEAAAAPISLEEVHRSMAAIERAVEMSYQYIFDYFVYTLMNRASNLQETEAHNLRDYPLGKDDGIAIIPPVLKLLHVPYRLYVRQQPLQPYPLWRAVRWIEGSYSFIQQVRLFEEAEAQSRDSICAQKEKELETLQIYQAVMKDGAWAWRSFYTAILCIEEEETVGRVLLQTWEKNVRGAIVDEAEASMTMCIVSEGKLRLLDDEARARVEIVAEELEVFAHLTEEEWRWDNLLRLRRELWRPGCGKSRWGMEWSQGMGRKFDSLDATARVIQRLFSRASNRQHRSEGAQQAMSLSQEMQLKKICADMVKTLEAQHCEENKEEELRAASSVHDKESDGIVESYLETAVDSFRDWFDVSAKRPMEENYKEIVSRFLQENRRLYMHMHILFAVVRNGRQRIEEQEAREYSAMQCTLAFVAIAIDTLYREETARRRSLESDAREEISRWHERAGFLAALAKYTATTKEKIKKSAHPPCMNHVERLLSREDVVRTRRLLEERRDRSGILLSLHAIVYRAILREEQQERSVLYEHIDECWSLHSPFTLLVKAEEIARRRVEVKAYSEYGQLLDCECAIYGQKTLFRQFLRGHLSFESEARYFDRQLTALLLQRVSHLRSKIDELVAAETCARARVEYFEEIHRDLYLCTDDVA
ncbi:hypothetical protein MOQ_001467 [Trypanosoma cruzi marinkellei]|uniref:Uncharacterized protein n=1 Tax=Trypanosoma cruzi marinkellei TaxID=85056 RepID=K2NKP8_TRYCR|nr:hypothetical protein MOQ_001467 [Trypanosoma cruzi marinkellei]